ncbi:MAG TPA: BamA/TamA family outer membrane protein [Gemmatimonadales bacterium]|nr:BamA/TamA family outer membrane protein [Gemmatimonadales bacterium]
MKVSTIVVRFAIAAVLVSRLTSHASPLAAQDSQAPWRLSYFPYFTVSPNDGLMGIARAIWFRQAEWGDRVTLENSVAVEAGYSTKGSWLARTTWANPRLAPGWRVKAHAEAGHEPRFGDPGALIERDRRLAWVDVTRRLEGPLHLAVRGGIRHDELSVPGNLAVEESDATVRGALILDLRDREFEVNRGVLLEGGVIFGSAGDDGYRAAYAHLRGWYNPLPYLRLTGRYAWRQRIADDPVAAVHEFPAWEDQFTTLGGHRSHRGFAIGELGAGGTTFAGVEARFDVINAGEMGALTLFAFADGGKVSEFDGVFQGIPCENYCAAEGRFDWKWAPGGGIALRVLRAATLTVSAARTDDRTTWYVGSGWSW